VAHPAEPAATPEDVFRHVDSGRSQGGRAADAEQAQGRPTPSKHKARRRRASTRPADAEQAQGPPTPSKHKARRRRANAQVCSEAASSWTRSWTRSEHGARRTSCRRPRPRRRGHIFAGALCSVGRSTCCSLGRAAGVAVPGGEQKEAKRPTLSPRASALCSLFAAGGSAQATYTGRASFPTTFEYLSGGCGGWGLLVGPRTAAAPDLASCQARQALSLPPPRPRPAVWLQLLEWCLDLLGDASIPQARRCLKQARALAHPSPWSTWPCRPNSTNSSPMSAVWVDFGLVLCRRNPRIVFEFIFNIDIKSGVPLK